MRLVATGLLSALLFIGCSDDSDDTDVERDGSVTDAGVRDAATIDSSVLDGAVTPRDGSTPTDADVGGSARASLVGKSGTGTTGTATFTSSFTSSGGLVTLTLNVSGATAGKHGVHLHVTGDCSADNASSAGGHWNPDMHRHGSGELDAGASSHLGDLGNITIAADGTGTLTHSNPEWKLGDGSTDDVVGRAIVVHKAEDDLMTQEQADAGITPGNSGVRISCGVITR